MPPIVYLPDLRWGTLLLLVALVLGGCATAPAPTIPDVRREGRLLASAGAINEDVTQANIGQTWRLTHDADLSEFIATSVHGAEGDANLTELAP
jgi:hypothetical protein